MDENFMLSFKEISYRVRPHLFSGESGPKEILKKVSGEFCGGELSAIIGLSGSGKTSLLDCLSGFRVKNVNGSIEVYDQGINIRKISSYIMQEQTLHEMLTVNETLTLSLNFKNNLGLTDKEKKMKVQGILTKYNICDKSESLVRDLSGGQKKRLTIAVEVIHDPNILFLDEPITGLDHVAATQCIYLLKQLAFEGKIVILTVHQPSALILNMFDHIYALADGKCIYQGSAKNIIQFLAELDLVCPSTSNPADFLLEISNNDYGQLNHILTQYILNGLNDNFRQNVQLSSQAKTSTKVDKNQDQEKQLTPHIWQIFYLMQRTFLITKRNKFTFHLRLGIHLAVGLFLGHIYQNVGSNGAASLSNYKFLTGSVIIQLFMGYFADLTTFPLEFAVIKREHFNAWYSTLAYYTAFVLFDLPITLLCCTSYVAITYYMTDQPAEIQRFLLVLGFCLSTAFTAQAMSIAATALMSLTFAIVFGIMFLIPIPMFSSALIMPSDVPPCFKIIFDSNFLDYQMKGVMTSIFGLNRSKLPCSQFYCHFENPTRFLRDTGLEVDIEKAFYVILFYFIVFRLIGFVLINFRLKNWH